MPFNSQGVFTTATNLLDVGHWSNLDQQRAVDFFEDIAAALTDVASARLVVTPEQFGAVGDGATNDQVALTSAIAAAATLKVPVLITKMHGLSTPLAIASAQNAVRIIGNRGFSELASGVCGFRKLAGFTGDAAIMVGTDSTPTQNIGFELNGVEIDGNSQTGDGVQIFRTGLAKLKNVYSHHNTTGYGFRFDGNWFGRFEGLVSKENGKTSTSQGGGFRFSHATRESSDSEMRECYSNKIGNVVLDFDARDNANANIRQTDWRFYGGEFTGGKFGEGYDGGTPARYTAKINGDRIIFFGSKFVGTISTDGVTFTSDAEKNVLIGTSGATYATKKIFFFGCTFQYGGPTRPTGDAAGYGVEFAGLVEDIDFYAPLVEGISNFADTNGAAALSGPVHIIGGDDRTNLTRDANRLIRTVMGGAVGLRYGAAQDQFNVESRLPGVPVNILRTDAGGTTAGIKLGSGASLNLIALQAFFLQTPPQAAAPADPVAGTIAIANRATWDPASIGSGGAYVVWYNGSAWVRIHEQ